MCPRICPAAAGEMTTRRADLLPLSKRAGASLFESQVEVRTYLCDNNAFFAFYLAFVHAAPFVRMQSRAGHFLTLVVFLIKRPAEDRDALAGSRRRR